MDVMLAANLSLFEIDFVILEKILMCKLNDDNFLKSEMLTWAFGLEYKLHCNIPLISIHTACANTALYKLYLCESYCLLCKYDNWKYKISKTGLVFLFGVWNTCAVLVVTNTCRCCTWSLPGAWLGDLFGRGLPCHLLTFHHFILLLPRRRPDPPRMYSSCWTLDHFPWGSTQGFGKHVLHIFSKFFGLFGDHKHWWGAGTVCVVSDVTMTDLVTLFLGLLCLFIFVVTGENIN